MTNTNQTINGVTVNYVLETTRGKEGKSAPIQYYTIPIISLADKSDKAYIGEDDKLDESAHRFACIEAAANMMGGNDLLIDWIQGVMDRNLRNAQLEVGKDTITKLEDKLQCAYDYCTKSNFGRNRNHGENKLKTENEALRAKGAILMQIAELASRMIAGMGTLPVAEIAAMQTTIQALSASVK